MKATKLYLVSLAVLAALLVLAPQARADIILTDNSTEMRIDPNSESGMYWWTVNGWHVLYQQWFWYRVGNTPEQTISSLPETHSQTVNTAQIVYTGSGFTVDLTFLLTGGLLDPHVADVMELIRITNTGLSNLDFHFFQYADFDLSMPVWPNLDTVTITQAPQGSLAAYQVGAKGSTNETTAGSGGVSTRYEAAIWPQTFMKLTNNAADNLNNNGGPVGPADVTWAFQWDMNLPPNGGVLISKDKWVYVVPEPAAILLLGGVLLLIGRRFRKLAA